ncbi:hypothetical protein D9M72_604700 [compost metagenome]
MASQKREVTKHGSRPFLKRFAKQGQLSGLRIKLPNPAILQAELTTESVLREEQASGGQFAVLAPPAGIAVPIIKSDA